MNQDERNARIEEYGRGFDLLAAALAEVPRAAWDFKPAPREWSIREVLVHMADSEIVGTTRLQKLIAEPGSTLMPYEPDKWAEAMNYQSQDAEDALQAFKLVRRRNYHLLKTLSDHVFMQSVVHPEFDQPYTFDQWLDIYTPHAPEHVEQIQKNHRAWKEQKTSPGF